MNSLYTRIEISKTGVPVPLKDGICVCSKYNPEKEAELFASGFEQSEIFFVVAGLCSGWHIEKLLKENPNRKVIVVENTREDFDFLMQIPLCKKLSEDERVIFSTPQTLFSDILNNYIPALFGKLNFCFLRGWENAFAEKMPVLKTIIDRALKTVKADFSVQSHFGKIWNKNIFENLKTASENDTSFWLTDFIKNSKKDRSKAEGQTAAVIAAGPSLDKSIEKLKKNPEKYFIISTDTAYSTLLRSKITPQIVVSLDGQSISRCHFLHKMEKTATVFAFDLCANSIPVKKLAEKQQKILFFESGHPLSALAANFCGKNFIHLNAGTGTVTIAAADLAFTLGFEKLEFFGADFAYSGGKPYAKGTYLDTLYAKDQNRLSPVEHSFCRLMYRTELIPLKNNAFTTEVLKNYGFSLETFLNSQQRTCNLKELPPGTFDLRSFYSWLKNRLLEMPEKIAETVPDKIQFFILPLMAYFEKTHSIQDSYKLARTACLRYTERI